MAIAVVNGYMCTSFCDVAKAKKGEDPHPLSGADKADAAKHDNTSDSSRTDGHAVLFGGSLSRSAIGVDATQTADRASTPKPVIDRLV
jgi:hypothetical protein